MIAVRAENRTQHLPDAERMHFVLYILQLRVGWALKKVKFPSDLVGSSVSLLQFSVAMFNLKNRGI